MKSEMIKFVSDNFEVIKNRFLKDEMNMLKEKFEDEEIDENKFNHLSEFLINQINVSTVEELIDMINREPLGVDLNSDEFFDLFYIIKELAN
jgi:signal recognition particle GTPase